MNSVRLNGALQFTIVKYFPLKIDYIKIHTSYMYIYYGYIQSYLHYN